MAMLPARSTARLGMKRLITFAPSGSQVVPCVVLAATVPLLTPIWYQRGAARPVVLARRTVWEAHSDSVPPMLVYWFCIMARICRTSSALPPSDAAFGTFAFGQLLKAFRTISGPVKVLSEMLFQSTWNL